MKLLQHFLIAILIAAPVAAFAQSDAVVVAAPSAQSAQSAQPDSAIVVHATTPDSTPTSDSGAGLPTDSALRQTSYGSTADGSSDSGPGDSKLGNAFTRTITSIMSVFATR
jgi:hypothetical protein